MARVTSVNPWDASCCQDDLQDHVAVPDRHQRLGQCRGVRAQPYALSASENHGMHVVSPDLIRYRQA